MSTVHCNTIQTSSGGAVTLTKQAAAKVTFGMNLRSSTSMDLATNAISTECLNISSGTDAGTGLARGNITNAMQNTQIQQTSKRHNRKNTKHTTKQHMRKTKQ